MILDRQTMRNVKGVKVTEAKNKEIKVYYNIKTERKFYDKLQTMKEELVKSYKKFMKKAKEDLD